MQINLSSKLQGDESSHYDSEYEEYDYYYYPSVLYIQYLVDGKVYSDYSLEHRNDGQGFSTFNISKHISLSGNTLVTVNMKYRAFNGGWNDNVTLDKELPDDKAPYHEENQGTCTLQSYSLDNASDSVIAHGTAGFIAIDPNSCPYTIVKG